MADPATNTAYPADIEVFPEISSATREDDAGAEHDVMHDKLHATINSLQAVVGTDAAADPASLTGRVAALEASPGGGAAGVPYLVPAGSTFTVALNTQALFTVPITVEAGASLVVDGILAEVN